MTLHYHCPACGGSLSRPDDPEAIYVCMGCELTIQAVSREPGTLGFLWGDGDAPRKHCSSCHHVFTEFVRQPGAPRQPPMLITTPRPAALPAPRLERGGVEL